MTPAKVKITSMCRATQPYNFILADGLPANMLLSWECFLNVQELTIEKISPNVETASVQPQTSHKIVHQ